MLLTIQAPGWLSGLSVQALGFGSDHDLNVMRLSPALALCWVWSLLKIHAPPPLRKHAPSLSKKKVTNYILQYPTCAAEVGIEAKTGNLRVREAVFFIRAISCEIVN